MPTFQIGTQAQRVHAPTDATRMLQRAGDQLVERMHEQLALADRREKRERGDDRLRRHAAFDRLDDAAGGELPETSAGITELRGDRRFGQCGERAKRADAELTETTMRVRIEREHSDGLGSEKLLFRTSWYDDRFARLGAAGRDPSRELPHSPTQPYSEIRNPQSNCFNDLHDSTENSFQTVGSHVSQSELSRLNDRTHFTQRREQGGKLFVVMHGIGLEKSQGRAETDRLTDCHAGLHTGMTSKRGHLPELSRRVRREQRRRIAGETLMTRLFTAKREERNPDTGSERARKTIRQLAHPKGTRIYPETGQCRKLPSKELRHWYI